MRRKRNVNALQILALGFAFLILIGTILLMLPGVSKNGIRFLDALFTSTSATCVTGLVVFDTATQFNFIGQLIILLLIQIGGLGFMTVIGWMLMAFGRRIGLRERSFLMESVNSMQLGGIIRLIKRILICTAICEMTGALLLSIRFIPLFGWGRGIWYSCFHSISAFCNAGFDLMGVITPYASLTPFVNDWLVNLTVMSLILIGGLGFIVWDDLIDNKFKFKKYRLQSKIVIVTTVVLLVAPTAVFALLEWNNTLAGMNVFEKLLASLFQTISPRTAGFNTVELSQLTSGGKLLQMLLMFIGGGAGSTAGGVKLTTIAVIIIASIAYAKRHEDTEAFGKRIPTNQVRRAYSSTLLYASVLLLGFMLLLIQGLAFEDTLYEAFSAIGTVGLTTGITRETNTLSRIILIIMMYCGRLGSLSVAMATTRMNYVQAIKLPEEKIMVG